MGETTHDGGSEIMFWEFVQLCRLLQNEQDLAEEERVARLMEELRFSTSEVEQFRQIFHDCAKREANMKLAESLGASRSAAQQKQENRALTREGIRRLVRSLGISISPENSILLEHQLKE